MEISSLGLTSFKIRGKKATAILNPFDPKTAGGKFPRVESAEVIILADGNDAPDFVAQWRKMGYVVTGPGEYEISGVDVNGVSVWEEKGGNQKRNTIYRIRVDGVSVGYFSGQISKLTEEQRDRVGTINVLILPLRDDLMPEAASALVAQLEPSYVIPADGKDAREKFLKELGAESASAQPKLVATADKLPETTTVVVLE